MTRNAIISWRFLALLFININIWCKFEAAVEFHDVADQNNTDCLSWRLNVELNNLRNWWTVPEDCLTYVQQYMLYGQYERDLATAVDCIVTYTAEISPVGDGKDAWLLDVDGTALSNLEYYMGRKFGEHAEKGKSAAVFKSGKREELMKDGYRIWGNVGDQWTDIIVSAVGARTFKLPNPMYFVP